MTVTDECSPWGIPRSALNAISELAARILALSGPTGPRQVACWDGFAEVLTHDELETLHNRIDEHSCEDPVARLLATVEALRGGR